MLFWLAAKFRIWDVDAFGAAIPAALLTEWYAFFPLKVEQEKASVDRAKWEE
jgi:hypothetical protein